MKTNKIWFLMLLMFLLISAGSVRKVQAQGMIVPGPCRRCPRPVPPPQMPRALPIKSINH